jgi:hypothetical protein
MMTALALASPPAPVLAMIIGAFLGYFEGVSDEFPPDPESRTIPSPRAAMCLVDKGRTDRAGGWYFADPTRRGYAAGLRVSTFNDFNHMLSQGTRGAQSTPPPGGNPPGPGRSARRLEIVSACARTPMPSRARRTRVRGRGPNRRRDARRGPQCGQIAVRALARFRGRL